MLVYNSRLSNVPVLSVQTSNAIAEISTPIVDPDKLKIIAFEVTGPMINATNCILDTNSIREYSRLGIIIDSIEELVSTNDVIRIKKVLELNFNLIGLKVETKKGTKLGHVSDFTVTPEDFLIKQIIVKRPTLKAFVDPELTIPRTEIVEITDYKIIVRDEEKTIKARASKEDFIPNFVNPFREKQPGFASADTKENSDKS